MTNAFGHSSGMTTQSMARWVRNVRWTLLLLFCISTSLWIISVLIYGSEGGFIPLYSNVKTGILVSTLLVSLGVWLFHAWAIWYLLLNPRKYAAWLFYYHIGTLLLRSFALMPDQPPVGFVFWLCIFVKGGEAVMLNLVFMSDKMAMFSEQIKKIMDNGLPAGLCIGQDDLPPLFLDGSYRVLETEPLERINIDVLYTDIAKGHVCLPISIIWPQPEK